MEMKWNMQFRFILARVVEYAYVLYPDWTLKFKKKNKLKLTFFSAWRTWSLGFMLDELIQPLLIKMLAALKYNFPAYLILLKYVV